MTCNPTRVTVGTDCIEVFNVIKEMFDYFCCQCGYACLCCALVAGNTGTQFPNQKNSSGYVKWSCCTCQSGCFICGEHGHTTLNCPYDIRKQNDNSNVFLCYGCSLPLGDHHGENNLPYGKCACIKWVTIIAHQLMCGDTEELRKLHQQAIHHDLVSDADVECMTTPQK